MRKRSFLLVGREVNSLPGDLFFYQEVKEPSSFSVNWKELSS